MRIKKRFLAVPLVLALSLGNVSCDLIKNCLDCLCPDLDTGATGITGNPKVDGFFVAAVSLEQASTLTRSEVNDILADLAALLECSATPEDVRAAIDDEFSSAGVGFTFEYQEPVCRADVDVAARAAAECDVTVDPGEVSVVCEGHCEGSCQGSCSAECTLPSVEAYCEGTCHGSCTVEASAECYGTCHGTCSGTCSYEESGECHGSCSGTCTGHCETRIEGSCTGECSGECELSYTPAECNGHCQGECGGHCEGSCEGTVRPPSVDADCEAQVEARVEASVECEPAQLDWTVDTTGIENIGEITYHMGRLLAAGKRAERISAALGDYLGALNTSAEAIFGGELDATDLACALQQLPKAIDVLGEANATLIWVVEVETTVLTP